MQHVQERRRPNALWIPVSASIIAMSNNPTATCIDLLSVNTLTNLTIASGQKMCLFLKMILTGTHVASKRLFMYSLSSPHSTATEAAMNCTIFMMTSSKPTFAPPSDPCPFNPNSPSNLRTLRCLRPRGRPPGPC
jgi:hypothetical protein